MSLERGSKLPFQKTREFVLKAHEEAYVGEMPQDPSRIDANTPFTVWLGVSYEAQFYPILRDKRNLTPPFVLASLNQKPAKGTPASQRRPNTALLYIFGDQTRREIASQYEVSNTQIDLDIDVYLTNIYRSASPQLQSEYPRSRLSTKKESFVLAPESPTGVKRTIAAIKRAQDAGAMTPELIEKYGAQSVAVSRRILRRYGLPGPDLLGKIVRARPEIDDPGTSLERLRELIQLFGNMSAINYYMHTTGDNQLLISIGRLQQMAWGKLNSHNTKQAFEMLRNAGLPVITVVPKEKYKGKIGSYRITFARCKEDALAILATAPKALKGSRN